MAREDRIWFDIREIAKDKAAHKRFTDAWYAAGFEKGSLVADYILLDVDWGEVYYNGGYRRLRHVDAWNIRAALLDNNYVKAYTSRDALDGARTKGVRVEPSYEDDDIRVFKYDSWKWRTTTPWLWRTRPRRGFCSWTRRVSPKSSTRSVTRKLGKHLMMASG